MNKPTDNSITDLLGDHWEEFEVFHPKFALWRNENKKRRQKIRHIMEVLLKRLIGKVELQFKKLFRNTQLIRLVAQLIFLQT